MVTVRELVVGESELLFLIEIRGIFLYIILEYSH
jgi:hypothetical protein